MEKLHKKGHAPLTRVLELKRQVSQIEGHSRPGLATESPASPTLVGEVGLQRIQAEKDFRESVTTELRDVRVRIQNLTERRVAAETRLDRIDIAAPQAGRVLALKAHTVGGVIQPGETIMEIVPGDDSWSCRPRCRRRTSTRCRPARARRSGSRLSINR